MRSLQSLPGQFQTCSKLLTICLVCTSWQIILAKQRVVFYDNRQADFVNQLEHYVITVPSRVDSKGVFLSHELHARHQINKRSADSFELKEEDEKSGLIHYHIPLEDKTLLVKLTKNERLLTPSTIIEYRRNRFKNVTDSVFRKVESRGCHFSGEVDGEQHSRVVLAACNGLMGFVQIYNEEYFIEPLKGHTRTKDSQHPHVIYKRSALPAKWDISRVDNSVRDIEENNSCGVQDETEKAYEQRERWQKCHRPIGKKHRKKRSISIEKHVETMVTVDPEMVEYYQNEDIENYVLTVMNMVATMFHDATIGNAVNIVIVRIILLQEDQDDLVITHHADKTLRSFCKWQKKMNFRDDDQPNHHDVAVLLTRHNICSRMNEPCSTLGLAQVAGMCQPHRTCSVNEDTGLALAFTISHELGHNFGMKHDNVHNNCESPKGEQYMMAPHLIADSTPLSWSRCSRDSITKFFDRDWGYCLDDEPAQHEFKFPVQPAGIMYDTDHQCRLQYGQDGAMCEGIEIIENVCTTLWCRVDNKCSTKLQAAAEGTICGKNKWCYAGKCVEIGERSQAINGEWGEWGGWTECTRTCGAGVSYSQRHCDNPPPSHGGKYCIGERKRYRICETDNCPEGVPSFRHKQCSAFNYVPYKKGLHEWEPVLTPHTPCQLHCKPFDKFFSMMLKDMVTDGTPCIPGGRNMCISGRCRHVGCDWIIDSVAVEDRCGVCYGDGSTCETVKKQFNETKKLGYVEATIIPKGARNIRVEEVAEANNFLALKNQQGEYYLNGHWFIQWSGDYEVAGTVVHYRREGNKESFNAPGPLKEPLHIMLLIQTHNPGVVFEYTVPKENATNSRTPEFWWDYTDWSHCTVSCGGGTQRSQVMCMEKEAGIVDEMYCNASTKPDDKLRSCNDHLCPARWWTGPWQHCSVTCGPDGIHRRTVICVRSLGPDEQIALENKACEGLDKPTEVESCRHKDPCPGASHWKVGQWSVCTRTCGEGVQVKKVLCPGGSVCNPETKPSIHQKCNMGVCPVANITDSGTAGENHTSSLENTSLGTTPVAMNNTVVTNSQKISLTTVSPATKFLSHISTTEKSAVPLNKTGQVTGIKDSSPPLSISHINNGLKLKSNSGTSEKIQLGETDISLNEGNDLFIPDMVDSSNNTGHKHRHHHNDRHKHRHPNTKDVVISGDKSSSSAKSPLIGKHSLGKGRAQTVPVHGDTSHFKPIKEKTSVIPAVTHGPDVTSSQSSFRGDYPSPTTSGGDNSAIGRIEEDLNTNDGSDTIEKKGQEELQSQKGSTVHFVWHTKEWSKCSRPCGGGVKTRVVYCIAAVSRRIYSNKFCNVKKKPASIEDCHRVPCLKWQTSDWTECSATCGYATQTRHVYCPVHHKCDKEKKLTTVRECNLQPCIAWVNGEWSTCSKTCEGGVQVRLVQCVNLTSQQLAKDCILNIKPREKQQCNVDECPSQNAAFTITCESNEMSYRVCKMLKKLNHCDKQYVRAKCCRTCGHHRRDKSDKPAVSIVNRR